MVQKVIEELFTRDLNRLSEEIKAYKNEADLWILKGEINNTAGNLCMHLIGNLNHFIGHTLGGSDYLRNRDNEFNGKETREKLLKQIEETKKVVSETILSLTDKQLEQDFPIRIFDREHANLHFVLHLSTHLNYHLGQINYHRRLIN